MKRIKTSSRIGKGIASEPTGNNNNLQKNKLQATLNPKNSFTTMNYSDCEVDDDDITSPQPQQEQQSTDQSPPSSATPLGSKGHST